MIDFDNGDSVEAEAAGLFIDDPNLDEFEAAQSMCDFDWDDEWWGDGYDA